MTTPPTAPPAAASPAKSLPATMRALVKDKAAPGLAFEGARPLPRGALRGVAGAGQPGEPGATEALIRVTHTGICGTDRHIWEWDEWASSRIPVGIVTGHEFVGVVERVGSSVEGIKPGMRVSAEGHITAGADYNSRTGNAHIARDTSIIGVDRDGCFADYIMMPACNLWPVHESIPDNWAAVMDPLGNAVHTVMAAGVSARSVLVTGVGTIGLMAVTVARAAGAAKIFAVDIDERRLDLARRLGADDTFDARKGDDWIEEIRRRTRGEGADALLEMSGAPSAIDAGFKALRNGGVAALLGIPSKPFEFDLTRHIVFKGATVLGINGRRMFETWYQMEDLLMSGRVHLDDVLTHEFPLEEYEKAFDTMRSGEAIKVVMRM